jgi:osmoprotectant transport system permease protein
VVSVGTATIAAAIGAGGLGTYVFRGIATVDARLILAGAVPAAVLALLVDSLLGAVEKSGRPLRAATALAAGTVLTLGGALLLARPASATAVVVGSKNFTEQVVLGEIVSQLLESRGFEVERKLNLGGTNLCHQGVLSGELDAYVEYTGTALADILRQPAHADPAAVLQEVRERYRALGLAVGEPLGFNNTYALVVRPQDSQRLRLRRISDLAPHASRLRVGCFGEFLERPDGMRGLLATYGFRFGPPPREMDLGLLYTALVNQQVDVVVGSATDGLISALHLVVMEDDRRYFPPYDAVPVTSDRSLTRHPGLREALNALAGRIHEESMRRMNYAVDRERRDPAEVAREFLRSAGLVRE